MIELWFLFGWEVGGRVGRDGFRSETAFKENTKKHSRACHCVKSEAYSVPNVVLGVLNPIVVADAFVC